MTGPGRGGVPLAALRRVTRSRPVPADGERCEMCAKPIAAAHAHVVDLQSRALMCACRPCYLLFADAGAALHYRSVPERYLCFAGTAVDGRTWDELEIPVGLAFLFRNSVQRRMVAFYPGPAGATESELPLAAWDRIVAQSPRLAVLRPDVEALLVRRPGEDCFVVPIDACYELVGQLRKLWRGFDGGAEAHAHIDGFFAGVRARSRPAPT
ncbi:DUF5947 family protein [Actinoplanes sp. NPDC049668]|uniref:DUF5947 family protein n=1 Tax=unclassified Actinoplanes TaxID=2626549 RepID=UPI0033BBBEC7